MGNADGLAEWDQPMRAGTTYEAFDTFVQSRCEKLLKPYRFKPLHQDPRIYECVYRQTFCAWNRCVYFEIDTHWRDVPVSGVVMLGTKFDHRSVNLHYFADRLGVLDACDYKLEGMTLSEFMDQAIADLQKYGLQFLEGGLSLFNEAIRENLREVAEFRAANS